MKRKLDIIRSKRMQEEGKQSFTSELVIDQTEQVKALQDVKESVDILNRTINDQEPLDLSVLSVQLEQLHKRLDFSSEFDGLRDEIREAKVETVTVKQFSELLEAVEANKPLPVNIDLTSLQKAILNVSQRVQDASVPNQAPEEYTAVRRVVKVGQRLIFDDNPTAAGGGGGGVGGQTDTTNLYNAGTLVTVKFAPISASSNGDNTIVSAVANKAIRVLSYVLMANGTVNAKWRSDTTDISGLFYLVANTGAAPGENQYGQFQTATGEALVLNLSGGIAVGGHLSYVEV